MESGDWRLPSAKVGGRFFIPGESAILFRPELRQEYDPVNTPGELAKENSNL